MLAHTAGHAGHTWLTGREYSSKLRADGSVSRCRPRSMPCRCVRRSSSRDGDTDAAPPSAKPDSVGAPPSCARLDESSSSWSTRVNRTRFVASPASASLVNPGLEPALPLLASGAFPFALVIAAAISRAAARPSRGFSTLALDTRRRARHRCKNSSRNGCYSYTRSCVRLGIVLCSAMSGACVLRQSRVGGRYLGIAAILYYYLAAELGACRVMGTNSQSEWGRR